MLVHVVHSLPASIFIILKGCIKETDVHNCQFIWSNVHIILVSKEAMIPLIPSILFFLSFTILQSYASLLGNIIPEHSFCSNNCPYVRGLLVLASFVVVSANFFYKIFISSWKVKKKERDKH